MGSVKYPNLYARIGAWAPIPEAEWVRAEVLGKTQVFTKKSRFLEPGQAADRFGFVLTGLFRAYRVSEEGVESVKAFRAEGELLGAYAEQLQGLPSATFIEALEPSTVLAFHNSDLATLEAGHPSWTQLARRIAEHHFVLKERREQEFLELDAEARWLRFREEQAHLIGRITQAEIAAYLGITPVALSRIVSRLRAR